MCPLFFLCQLVQCYALSGKDTEETTGGRCFLPGSGVFTWGVLQTAGVPLVQAPALTGRSLQDSLTPGSFVAERAGENSPRTSFTNSLESGFLENSRGQRSPQLGPAVTSAPFGELQAPTSCPTRPAGPIPWVQSQLQGWWLLFTYAFSTQVSLSLFISYCSNLLF